MVVDAGLEGRVSIHQEEDILDEQHMWESRNGCDRDGQGMVRGWKFWSVRS